MLWRRVSRDKPERDISYYIKVGLLVLIGVILFSIIGNQSVIILMNIEEFGELYTKPLYYSFISGLILAAIALVRVDIRSRRSLVWWITLFIISYIRGSNEIIRYQDFKLSKINFIVWQVTKVFLLAPLFTNVMFGLTLAYMLDGNDIGLSSVLNIFSLPFITSPDPSIAESLVIPMIPALTLFIPPLLSVIGIRLILYVGLHHIASTVMAYVQDVLERRPRYLFYISVIEMIIGIGLFWSAFNMFFTSRIDYNTKYAIIGTILVGIAFITWSIIDRRRSRLIILPSRSNLYVRILTIVSIAVIVGVIMAINNSIADARKIEWLGPYTAQQIAVNRYIAELDKVKEYSYDVKLLSVAPTRIPSYTAQNIDLLSKIRVWDWTAGFAKLKPAIGLIPYVDFADSDIVRFNDTLYWTAAMTPKLPEVIQIENRWYAEHFVYTHVPNGFLMLNAHNGNEEDSGKFFTQRRIYYGEGRLFASTWAAFLADRQSSDEVDGHFYSGKGGITISPPLTWLFEPNFLLSYPDKAIHVLRYRDIYDRMSLLYPYFNYNFGANDVDVIPVTDGQNTYWLMPLIVRLNTDDVPWSVGNPLYRLVGYALIDVYDGTVNIIVRGDDFFTNIFLQQYSNTSNISREMPPWLTNQLRYPPELFIWKVQMYNFYHVTDITTFITAREFYEIPARLEPYYIFAKPPNINNVEYIGLLSLELRGAAGRNLAGYMIVRNDYPNDGELIFYQVPIGSNIQLLGPTAVQQALDRDPDFATLRTLLRNPRIGDNILYRIGEQDVYFIPIYTAGAEGVVAQLGKIAAVGAAFTGDYYVGLGDTPVEAFNAYLAKLAGLTRDQTGLDKQTKLSNIMQILQDKGISTAKPTSINVPLTFKEKEIVYSTQDDFESVKGELNSFISSIEGKRVIIWEEQGDVVNIGLIKVVDGIPELHYVSVKLGG
jgi:uncharacterized membrane protein (UPF0182 family)